MKPSKLKRGDRVLFKFNDGVERIGKFICRQPARFGHSAINFVQFPDFFGQLDSDDQGICHVSDYDPSRKARLAP